MLIRIRAIVIAVVAMTVLGTISVLAQGTPYTREEWNDYQDANSGATAEEKVAGFEAFLQKHPESTLRAVFHNEFVKALDGTKNYGRILGAVDTFLNIDRETFTALNYDELTYSVTVYNQHRTYTYSVLQLLSNGAMTDAQMAGGIQHARTGLESLPTVRKLYAGAGATAEQIGAETGPHELMYHQVLATLTWRQRDYEAAIPELNYLMEKYPTDANLPLQLGYSYLNRGTPDPLKGIWYLARAVSLGHPQADSARRTVLGRIVRHSGVAPSCMQGDIDAVYTAAGEQMHPPVGWSMISSDQINAARQGITQVGLFDELAVGTEDAHIAWLAACGIPFGLGDDGSPTYEAVLLSFEETEIPVEAVEAANDEVESDGEEVAAEATVADAVAESGMQKAVILRVAATPSAVTANAVNMEVVVLGFTNVAKLREETNQTIKIGGTIASYGNDPFVLRLKEGKVDFLAAIFDEQKR